jgi:hypothetical protein
MKRLLFLMTLLIAGMNVQARPDSACQEDCVRQGYAWKYCANTCGGQDRRNDSGIMEQPGLPRNPAFDQLERDTRPADRTLAPMVDKKCMSNCRANGYNDQLCRRQCSY